MTADIHRIGDGDKESFRLEPSQRGTRGVKVPCPHCGEQIALPREDIPAILPCPHCEKKLRYKPEGGTVKA